MIRPDTFHPMADGPAHGAPAGPGRSRSGAAPGVRLRACLAACLSVCAGALVSLSAPPPALAQAASGDVVGATRPAPPPVQRALSFAPRLATQAGALVIPLSQAQDLNVRASLLPRAEREAVARALVSARFSYGLRQSLSLRGIGGWDRILIVGLGPDPDGLALQTAGIVAGRALLAEPAGLNVLAGGLRAEAAAAFATGMGIGEYRSDLHQAGRRLAGPPAPTLVVTDAEAAARDLYETRGRGLIEAMAWTRDVSNEPANVIYPESFVERARLAFIGLREVGIDVLTVPDMERLGMGAILGSARGSERDPRILIVRYTGPGAPQGGPIVLAGKGITFDTGGISLKAGAGMGAMKMDMSGAASVVGAVLSLAKSRAPVNVVAIAALSENMPDGEAIRPGDVLTAMNGKTIEIISTDAEGRLVLSDALAYAEANLRPSAIIDLATLTGAIGTALGEDYAGLFSRHDALADQIIAAGRASGERVWRMPLHPDYAQRTASDIADIKNSGDGGAGAGTGAHFIGEFVSRDMPWAHLDIAGVAYGGANDQKPAGSAAWGVRLLDHLVRNWRPVPRGPGASGF